MLLFLVRFTICMAFYVIGAYATTDILRLLKNNPTEVGAADCFCENCGRKLSLREQIPIFAFLWSRGKCRSCGMPIPIGNFLFEVIFTTVFIFISLIADFAPAAWLFCILFYETVKFLCVWRCGKRGAALYRGLWQSLLGNLVNFSLLGILFALHFVVIHSGAV